MDRIIRNCISVNWSQLIGKYISKGATRKNSLHLFLFKFIIPFPYIKFRKKNLLLIKILKSKNYNDDE